MRRLGRILASSFLSLALLAIAGEEAFGHRHAFVEEDLAAHSLVVVDHSGEYETDIHYDRAVDAHHAACPACTLSASPFGPPGARSVLGTDAELRFRLRIATAARHDFVGVRSEPARGPPASRLDLV